jgi:DNA-binding NarL/FixJ family response regulator
VFRKGLRDIIEADGRFRILHEAGDGREALEFLRQSSPVIAVLDVDMPELNGIEVARCVCKEQLPVDVIFLTMYKEETMFNRAMDLGIRGYVLKENAVTDILACLRAVADGHVYVSPLLSEYLVRRRTLPGN